MLKKISNPRFSETITIAHELLDYEIISLKPKKKSHKSLNELLEQAAQDIEGSKDRNFDDLRQEHGLDTLSQIRTTLQDMGYRQVTGRKDYLTPLNTALRDKRLDPFNAAIISFSIAQISGMPLTVHLNGSNIFLRYNCPHEFYWNLKQQIAVLDKIDVTDLEQISIELTTDHIIAMHQVVKAHYFQLRKDHEKALQYVDLAIQEFPDYWLAHKIKGVSLDKQGELTQAIQSYTKAIALNLSDNNTRSLSELTKQKKQQEDFARFSAIMNASM